MNTDAVILVGGFGSRLRPLTLSTPKPMLPAAGVPLLTHLITRIRNAGVRHVVLGTSYRAEVFEEVLGDGAELGVDLEYEVESEPLGTGGAIRNVLHRIHGDNAMIFNGDVLSGLDLTDLLRSHRESAAEVTLHLTRVPDPRAYGCVPTDATGRVEAFLEKAPDPVTDQINAGTYVFRRSVIETIPAGVAVSVERETFPELLARGARVHSHLDQSYWRDLGTPMDFILGSADLVTGRAPTSALPGSVGEHLVLPGAQVSPEAILRGGTTVGAGCVVGAGAVIDGSVLFDGAVVNADAVVRNSAVGRDAVVGRGAVLDEVVVGDRATIGAYVELRSGARVWPDATLSDGAVRYAVA